MTCGHELDVDEPITFVKRSPIGISNDDAWALFDRSVEIGLEKPDAPIVVVLDELAPITALKVYGPAPYVLAMSGPAATPIGFDPIDLSTLSHGWHTFWASSPPSTAVVELSFTSTGGEGAVPEVELWGAGQLATGAADLAAAALSEGYVTSAPQARVVIAPGLCTAFSVSLPRRPELMRRAHLSYRATDLLREFVVKRSINGHVAHGGSWLPGTGISNIVDEIDPQTLRPGINDVSLCVPETAVRGVTVESLRIIGELDRGLGLASRITIGEREGSLLRDGDVATSMEVAASEPVTMSFDRLIAPDAIALAGQVGSAATVTCLDAKGQRSSVASRKIASGLQLDGGSLRCAALTLSFEQASILAEIDVVGSGAGHRVDWPRLVVTSPREHFGEVAWIGGFVARPHAMTTAIRIAIGDDPVDSRTGDFGSLVKRASDVKSAWTVPLTAAFPDGTTERLDVVLDRDRHQDLLAPHTASANGANSMTSTSQFGREGDVAVARATEQATTKIRLGTRVGLDVPATAVSKATDVTVKHLGDLEVPPLDDGLINVTGPQGHAYEFLPHGQKFNREIDVVLPYDPSLIPEGMTAADVNAYFFDPKTERWTKLPRRALDIGERITRSGTTHFTIMINAVLAVPKSPTPLSFDPTTLSSIAAASPAANIDLVEPPTASSTGDARLALPIRIPTGRGRYSPSIGINYASGSGNGWLGIGWDLPVGRVEIDTRWGTPKYTATGDRYVLDGAELVPTTETDGPACRGGGGGKRFRTRIEGGFAHILRCEHGGGASDYGFEAHDRDGTLFVYGVADATNPDEDPRHAALTDPEAPYSIFRWNLREVVDVHGNTTTYFYDVHNAGGPQPGRETYLNKIEYTSHASASAIYRVEFLRDDGSRRDRIISGRPGFKTVIGHLLRRVLVTAQNQIVRDYVLTYTHGQFDKSVLANVREYGTTGCDASADAFSLPACTGEFHQHTFDYLREDEGFDAPVALGLEGPAAAQAAPLARGVSSSTSLSSDVGLAWGPSQQLSINASSGWGIDRGSRSELVGTYDVDGNGTPDEVYMTTTGPKVLFNQASPSGLPQPLFVERTFDLPGLNEMGREHRFGFEVHTSTGGDAGDEDGDIGIGSSLSAGWGNSLAISSRFLTDLDGDGFVDFLAPRSADPRRALLGRPCPSGLCFSRSPFAAVAAVDPRTDPTIAQVHTDVVSRLVLADPVLQWIAPFTGRVRIDASARKINPGGADGVAVELFHNDTLVSGVSLAPDATAEVALATALEFDIEQGEALYLRVKTFSDDGIGADGTLQDLVDADLFVVYERLGTEPGAEVLVNPGAPRQPTGAGVYAFDGRTDFRLSGAPAALLAPAQGTLELNAILTKRPGAADLRACVQRFAAPSPAAEAFPDIDVPCSATASGGTLITNVTGTISLLARSSSATPLPLSIPVEIGEILVLRVESDLSFDPDDVALELGIPDQPLWSWSRLCEPDETLGVACTTDLAELEDRRVAGAASFGPFVPKDPGTTSPRVPLVIATGEATDVVNVDPLFLLSGEFLLAIRSDRKGLIQQYDCRGVTCAVIHPDPFAVEDGESISFEVVRAFGLSGNVTGSFTNGGAFSVALIDHPLAPPVQVATPFIGGYHGFGAALWNEHEPFAPTSVVDDFPNLVTLEPARQIEIRRSIFPPSPSWGGDSRTGGARAWLGDTSAAFVAAGTLHASHLGLISDEASFSDAGVPGQPVADVGGLFTGGYLRLSATSSKFIGTEAHLAVFNVANFSLNLSASKSETTTTTDVVDMNGDGIADVIAGPAATVLGKLVDVLIDDDRVGGLSFDGGLRKRAAYNYAVGLGGGAASPCTTAGGRPTLQCGATDRAKTGGLGVSTGIGWGISRSQTTDELADLNGDGLPDVVKRRGTEIRVRYNLGNRFGAEELFGVVAALLREPADGFAVVAEHDVPVLGDALDSSANALAHETTLTETRTTSANYVVFSGSSSHRKSVTRTTRQLADLNGDGMIDLLFKRDCAAINADPGNPLAGPCEGRILVQYNRGGDFADPVPWTTPDWQPAGGGAITLSPTFDPGVTNLYVTGPDVLAATGTDTSRSTGFGIGGVIPLPYGFSLKLGGNASKATDIDSYELALMDMDGDGAADHTLRRTTLGGTPTIYIKRNQISGQANLLRSVQRPLGGSFTLAYQRVGNTVDQPHSRHVLSRVEVDDGQNLGAAFASPNLVTTFEYAGGFHHRYEKEFFGFSEVTSHRADGVTVEDQYENHSYQLHGRLLRQVRRDSTSNLLDRRELSYTPNAVLDGAGQPIDADPDCIANLHPLLGLDACVPAFVVMTEEVNQRFEGAGSKRHVVRDLSRDRFGNVLSSFDEGDDAITGDEVFAIASYANDTTNWTLGRSTRLEVHAGNLAGPRLRQRTGIYNSLGDLTTLSVDTGEGVATTTLGYDTFGNVNHVTTPPNAANQPQTMAVVFDSIAHSFPASVTNGFGYTSTATYDLKFGVALLETDTNAAQMTRTVDTFGRLSTVRGPYDTTQAGITVSYFPLESPPRAVTVTHASAPADYTGPLPSDLTTVVLIDGTGEPIQTRKTSVVNGVLGMTTDGLVARDDLGRTIASYQPFFTPGASVGFASPVATPHTTGTFDSRDRVLATTHPDGAAEASAFDLASSPGGGPVLFRTTSTDANGHVRETFVDLLDRTRVFVEHPTPTSASVTRYDYRPTGELAQIIDAEGNETALGYDLRGIRTSLANPDTGLIEEQFDLMGNRIALIEPNHRALGAEVRFIYDRSRLTKIDYPSKTDVTFSYGAPGAADFRAGRLTQVNDETGTQQHFYGASGETRRTLRSVVDPAHPNQAAKLFDFRFTTDSLGRQLRIQYPDGERVTNSYDAGGMLATIVGAGTNWTKTYLSELRYDVFGNQTSARFGNNVVSTWTFDPLRVRLTSALTTLPSMTKVQDLHYSYDPGGNPTSIQNTLPPPPTNGKLPGTSGATFSYDGVDRLVHSLGQGLLPANKSTTYDLAFTFTASHKISHKALDHQVINNGGNVQHPSETNFSAVYTYAARPHLPSRVDDNDLTYDPSGNVIRRQRVGSGSHQDYVWDDDGRLVEVSGQGANQRNVYDASGLRVLRDGQGGTTIFANAMFDLDGNKGHKHIFAGSTRIASVIRNHSSSANPSLPSQPGTAYFFHVDHLGSTGAVTKDDGGLNDAHDYFPDGQAWIDAGPKNSVNGYLFNGKQIDPETGFYDFGQRFYEPKTSLWLGVDPAFTDQATNAIGRPQVLSSLAYAAQNPLAAVDPDGRDFLWKHGSEQAPTFQYVTEEYGPNAWVPIVTIVEGRAGGLRMQSEGFAALRGEALVERANIGPSPVTIVLTGAKNLADGLRADAENGEVTPEVAWGMFTMIAGGGLGKSSGGLASGPMIPRVLPRTTGRAAAQTRLRALVNDTKLGAADRGWIRQEINAIERGKRSSIRNPPGKDLAHSRGREAAKGYDHVQSPSRLQDRDVHRTQHKFDDFGRKNKERP